MRKENTNLFTEKDIEKNSLSIRFTYSIIAVGGGDANVLTTSPTRFNDLLLSTFDTN